MPRKTPEVSKCPLCQKSLTSKKYITICPECYKTFQKQKKIAEKELQTKIQAMQSEHKESEERLKKDYETRAKKREKFYNESIEREREEFEKWRENREKQYEEMGQRREKELKEESERRKKGEQQLIEDYGKKIKKLDEELKRRDKKIAELEQVKGAMPSELKGVIGVEELLKRLRTEFPDDKIELLSRPGKEEGDIKHRVRGAKGRLIDPSIIYDNKFAKRITKKDVEKVKKYQVNHNTRHVYIVASTMPSKFGSQLIAEKDGATIIHSSMIIDVIKQLRKSIIELSREKMSKKDREAKEYMLYDYIKSPKFNQYIERLSEVHQKLVDTQNKEKKAHKRLWKVRAKLQDQLRMAAEEITTSIDTILQEKPPMAEISIPIKKKSKKKE